MQMLAVGRMLGLPRLKTPTKGVFVGVGTAGLAVSRGAPFVHTRPKRIDGSGLADCLAEGVNSCALTGNCTVVQPVS